MAVVFFCVPVNQCTELGHFGGMTSGGIGPDSQEPIGIDVPRDDAQQESAKGHKRVRCNRCPKETQRQSEEVQDYGTRSDKYTYAKCDLANSTSKRVRTSDFLGQKVPVDVETQIRDYGYHTAANRET